MQFLEELRLRDPVSSEDFTRIEGKIHTHLLIDGQIKSLAQETLKQNQGFFEKLGQNLGLIKSQPGWESWEGHGAGHRLKCAALQHAGWTFNDSNLPYDQAARAYERVRQALLCPECRTAEDLLRLLQ